jgi:hypothetical protein
LARSSVTSVTVSQAVPARVLSPVDTSSDAHVWKSPRPVSGNRTKRWKSRVAPARSEPNPSTSRTPGRLLNSIAVLNRLTHTPSWPCETG